MEMEEKIPQLTLTPELEDQPVFETKPETTLVNPAEQVDNRPESGPDMSQLSEAEQKAVIEFAEKIDITDSGLVLQYGAAAQKNIADFSGSALNNVRTKDMGEVGQMLGNLVVELKGMNIDPEEKKGLKGLFILGLALSDGAAELQAAFLEEGSRHEGIRSAFTRQTLCLNGMLPALRVTPSDDIKGGKAAEAQGLPAIREIRGR